MASHPEPAGGHSTVSRAIAATTFDFNEWVQTQVKRTPWWAISVAFHLLIFLVLLSIKMGEAGEQPPPPITVNIQPPPPDPLKLEKPEREEESDIEDEKSVEDPTLRDAEEADHNETADNEDFEQAKGDSLDFISDKNQQNTGVFDSIGLGGGAGGKYGGRLGGRRNLAAKGGGGKKSIDSAIAGLKWLARHQHNEGYWDCNGFHSQCKDTICSGPGYPEYDVGVTGLSLLAFLGAGYTHLSKATIDGINFGSVVKRGLLWLQKQQDVEGLFGGKSSQKYMYNHTLAALAMCEAYGMTTSPLFEKSAKKGIEYMMRAQTKYRAWRYEFQAPDNDMSVTGWAVMALKSAELAEIAIGQSSYQGALNFLNEVTEDMYFRVGYQTREDAGTQVSEKGRNDQFKNHQAMTAIGMLLRMYIEGNRSDPKLEAQAKILMQDLPDWNKKELTNDYYYWYYATLALYNYDGPDSGSPTQKYWKEWNKTMLNAIVKNQKKKADKCAEGSWDADDERWSYEGGRIYGTAINTLTLEVYYRYENAFLGFSKKKEKAKTQAERK